MKLILPEVPALMQTAIRFLVSTLMLLGWLGYKRHAVNSQAHLFKWGVMAGVLFTLEFLFISLALTYTSPSRLTIFLYTSPFVVALVLPVFIPAERMGKMQWAGLVCAFLAVLLVFVSPSNSGNAAPSNTSSLIKPWVGDVLALLAGLAWGLTTVLIRAKGLTQLSAETLMLYQVAVSAMVLSPLSLLGGQHWLNILQATSQFSMLILIAQVLCAFVSYLAWMWMLARYPATKMSSFVFLSPVFTLIFSGLWLGEAITLNLIVALGLVGVGIALVNRK